MTDSDTVEAFYLPPKSTVCTRTFWLFMSDCIEVVDAFYFSLYLAHRADDVSVTAAKALLGTTMIKIDRDRLQETLDNPDRAKKELFKYSELNSKNIVANIAEGFLWYLSNIIQNSIRRRPEMIKSGESIKIEEIFNYSSRRELINYLIDRKINSLSYGGVKLIEKYLHEALGIKLFRNEEERDLLRIFIEVRNVHAHNRGRVNRLFLERVGDCGVGLGFGFKEGMKAHLDYRALCLMYRVCIETALELDRAAASKFGIERKRLSTWGKVK